VTPPFPLTGRTNATASDQGFRAVLTTNAAFVNPDAPCRCLLAFVRFEGVRI
jgi:hypothetical protein